MSTLILGRKGEEIAVDYFIEKGYEIVERNYHFGHGEIDIIAKKNRMIVFAEVKTRKSAGFGTPDQAVNFKKMKLLLRTADGFLLKNSQFSGYEKRLDFIAIIKSEETFSLDHYENVTQLI